MCPHRHGGYPRSVPVATKVPDAARHHALQRQGRQQALRAQAIGAELVQFDQRSIRAEQEHRRRFIAVQIARQLLLAGQCVLDDVAARDLDGLRRVAAPDPGADVVVNQGIHDVSVGANSFAQLNVGLKPDPQRRGSLCGSDFSRTLKTNHRSCPLDVRMNSHLQRQPKGRQRQLRRHVFIHQLDGHADLELTGIRIAQRRLHARPPADRPCTPSRG